MKTYHVVFAESAKLDIFSSYEWGLERWGKELAQEWAHALYKSAESLLGVFPLSQPIAPESADTPYEVRQMIVGRYRLLFVVNDDVVTVLHVRGAFWDSLL